MTLNIDIERQQTDILILGTGGAGMFAALHAQQTAPAGTKITIAVKGLIGKCGCTRMVQGGYNVALGGGDTVSAVNNSSLKLSFTHLSTAGGAFLEYLEGKDLPGLSVLK